MTTNYDDSAQSNISGTLKNVGSVPLPNEDAVLTQSIIVGQSNFGSEYIAAKVTPDGGLVINQNIIVDPLNSSTTNLAAGQTFTGPAVTDLTATAVQYILHTDKNCLVYIDQSPDGTNWDISDMYRHYSSDGGSANTVQLVGSYYRIRVTNIAETATTHFRLQTILVPLLNPLPRSLDEGGNLKVYSYGQRDHNGFELRYSAHGEMLYAPNYRLAGGSFTNNVIDPNIWIQSLGTGGSITTDGQITLHTGTTANNLVSVQSVVTPRFTAGQALKYRAVAEFPDLGVVNNTRRCGPFTDTNGCFFELNGTTFRIATRKGSITTYVDNGSFNGHHGSVYSFTSPTRSHTFEIIYSVQMVYFVIDGEVIHTVMAGMSPWTDTLHLPIRFENFNSNGSTTDVTFKVRASITVREGIPQTQPLRKFVQGLTAGAVLKYSPGNIHGVILSGITNNAVVTLYDNTAASGEVIWSSGPLTANGLPFMLDFKGIPFSIGLTVAITGANMNVLVMYE